MQPYDWCNPRCPDPCTCQETINRKAGVGYCSKCGDRMPLDGEPYDHRTTDYLCAKCAAKCWGGRKWDIGH